MLAPSPCVPIPESVVLRVSLLRHLSGICHIAYQGLITANTRRSGSFGTLIPGWAPESGGSQLHADESCRFLLLVFWPAMWIGCRINFFVFLLVFMESLRRELDLAIKIRKTSRESSFFAFQMCENLRRQLESAAKMRETLHERPIWQTKCEEDSHVSVILQPKIWNFIFI